MDVAVGILRIAIHGVGVECQLSRGRHVVLTDRIEIIVIGGRAAVNLLHELSIVNPLMHLEIGTIEPIVDEREDQGMSHRLNVDRHEPHLLRERDCVKHQQNVAAVGERGQVGLPFH